ncbi:MarR family winged helix-turn-helix transcriptional regulator [Pseudomonas sp. NCHU5208]|uniref:MarR family winged helix-turn-helix transcriptional regulator n=1 Tax=unclassified Pseudomonas TaxID=196821 RepID=UPI003F953419
MAEKLADAVFESIHGVMHLYRAQQYRVLRDGPHDLTHMEYKVLNFFAAQPDATLRELVQHSGRDKAQLARLIKELRDKGLLDGQVDAVDRRITRLRLTPAGQAVHEALRQQGQVLNEVVVQGLSPEEQEQLLALLERVGASLRSFVPD